MQRRCFESAFGRGAYLVNAAACNGKDPFGASANCKTIFTGLVAQSKACDPSCLGGSYQCLDAVLATRQTIAHLC